MSVDLWDGIESRNEHIAELEAEIERLRAYVGTIDATERRLRALLRRARQALRSFDELSDEELGSLLTALNAAVE